MEVTDVKIVHRTLRGILAENARAIKAGINGHRPSVERKIVGVDVR